MKGASGAFVNLNGDRVSKVCNDAFFQVEWFSLAAQHGLVDGVRVPAAELLALREYHMEFIRGHCATSEPSVMFIDTLLHQVMRWKDCPVATNGDWASYLNRLEHHVKLCESPEMAEALTLFEKAKPFEESFCHGDLTLENVLIDLDGICALIDPNFKADLFQSYILDLGKLLQSTHAGYHKVFHSHHGVDLSRHDEKLKAFLVKEDLWDVALLSCISHVMRLRKYRPHNEAGSVDQILKCLTREYLWS